MKKILLFSIAIVTIGAAAFWFFFLRGEQNDTTDQSINILEDGTEIPIDQPPVNAEGLPTYRDDAYGFTLSYPQGYTIGKFSQGEGDTFVIQNTEGVGMQLVVTPFDENITLTAERIKQDLPDLPMRDIAQTKLPSEDISAVVFKSSGGGFGDSIELWFVYGGYLYQASTYLSQLTLLENVIGTLRFN